jgi:hypothetical protein
VDQRRRERLARSFAEAENRPDGKWNEAGLDDGGELDQGDAIRKPR